MVAICFGIAEPPHILVNESECAVDHEHKEHVAGGRCLEADRKVLRKGFVSLEERRLGVLPEEVQEEAAAEECDDRFHCMPHGLSP